MGKLMNTTRAPAMCSWLNANDTVARHLRSPLAVGFVAERHIG